MTTFVALYRGHTIAEARLIAVSADADLVSEVSTRLLETTPTSTSDPVVQRIEHGRTEALRLVQKEVSDSS